MWNVNALLCWLFGLLIFFLGDSKRALDEYISEICLGGLNTISIHNTCEDSLLASPIILDLVILAEFCTRVQFSTNTETKPVNFNVVLSILSYLLKAPLLPKGITKAKCRLPTLLYW